MQQVKVVGVGMTKFGKFLDRSIKDLGVEAVQAALADAGLKKEDLQAAFVGSAVMGLITGQECIRGQVILRHMGIGDIPVINLENACASASTAFHQAWMAIASGLYDVVLALGIEKLYHQDKAKSFNALAAAVDVEEHAQGSKAQEGGLPSRSMFMDLYAGLAIKHMEKYGTTREQFAKVAVKNHYNGCLNPHAQYQKECTVEEVLNSPLIVYPLTLLMCSPLGDGAAAAILCSPQFAKRASSKPINVAATILKSGMERDITTPSLIERAARQAYEIAGLGAEDVNIAEVHDATTPAELFAYEDLGLCPKGEGGWLIDEGKTWLGGSIPVNTSGGLCAKGHPVGASGLAQIAEVVWQLRGHAGQRQVKGAKVGLTQNAGGWIGNDTAAGTVSIFTI